MNEFVACGNCSRGYIYDRDNETGELVAKRCSCLTEWLASRKQQILLEKSGLPAGFLHYTIDDYKGKDEANNVGKLKLYVAQFEEKFRNLSLYLWSEVNGTQKTTVAKWILGQVIEKGFSARFVNMNELVEKLIKNYFDGSYQDEIDHARDVDLLVVDDAFDSQKVNLWKSGYQLSYIDTFFRVRLEQHERATIFTANVDPSQIHDIYNQSIGNLILRNVVDFEFKDVIVGGEARTAVSRIENPKELFRGL